MARLNNVVVASVIVFCLAVVFDMQCGMLFSHPCSLSLSLPLSQNPRYVDDDVDDVVLFFSFSFCVPSSLTHTSTSAALNYCLFLDVFIFHSRLKSLTLLCIFLCSCMSTKAFVCFGLCFSYSSVFSPRFLSLITSTSFYPTTTPFLPSLNVKQRKRSYPSYLITQNIMFFLITK
ncbi:MAG: hypothetical protein J3R72DRAFT_236155 [Linnemannia gamsii]|nr:MAG: hypothetical protein J3R72DRAFT_236155 [Linnemannia gamsii]